GGMLALNAATPLAVSEKGSMRATVKRKAARWQASSSTLLLPTARELSADLLQSASLSRWADTWSKLWSKRGYVRQTRFVLNTTLSETASHCMEPPAMLVYLPLKHRANAATSIWIAPCSFPRSKRAVVHSLGLP